MNKRVLLSVCSVIFILSSTVFGTAIVEASPSTDYFFDDFNDGIDDGWGRELGNWVVVSGEYTSTGGPGYSMSSILGYQFIDFDFNADLRITDQGAAHIGLRVKDIGGTLVENGVLLVIFPGGNSVYWHVYVNGVGAPQNIEPLGVSISENPLNIRVEVVGDTYKAYVDGVLKSTLIDSTYDSGQIVLGINLHYPTPTTWDNVEIESDEPFIEPSVGVPALSYWGIAILVVLLFISIFWMVRKRQQILS